MKYGKIAGNASINKTIYQCFSYIDDTEAEKFVRKFNKQFDDKNQVMHTFRELLLGAYLSKNGFRVAHDFAINTKTPDWCVLNDTNEPKCIVELLNFHPDAETYQEMVRQQNEKGIWVGWVPENTDRLYQTIWDKARKYKSLVKKHNLAYVISVFGGFDAFVEQNEIKICLFNGDDGLFEKYPLISGLLYFEESGGNYRFIFYANRNADLPFIIPDSWFP